MYFWLCLFFPSTCHRQWVCQSDSLFPLINLPSSFSVHHEHFMEMQSYFLHQFPWVCSYLTHNSMEVNAFNSLKYWKTEYSNKRKFAKHVPTTNVHLFASVFIGTKATIFAILLLWYALMFQLVGIALYGADCVASLPIEQ